METQRNEEGGRPEPHQESPDVQGAARGRDATQPIVQRGDLYVRLDMLAELTAVLRRELADPDSTGAPEDKVDHALRWVTEFEEMLHEMMSRLNGDHLDPIYLGD